MAANRRMTLTVAFACALSSIGIYPLFIGSAWFYAGLGAIITVAASGALSRLRTLPVVVCLAISVAGLLLYLNLVFEVRHSWALVIPTPGSLSRLWDLAGTAITNDGRYAPPVAELSSLVLIAVSGIGLTAILTDLIAVRLRSTALAGLPLLVLFTVPVTMNAQHESIGTAVVFCLATVGYLAMLSADGRERIRVWGRLVSLWRSGSLYDGMSRPGAARAGDVYPGVPAEEQMSPAGRITGREPGPDTRALAAAGRGEGWRRRPGGVRVAARAGPAPEQAVLLGSGHRRQRRQRDRRRAVPPGHAVADDARTPGQTPDHRADLHHHRREEPSVSPDLRVRRPDRFGLAQH
jgi:hypothetical protein